MVRSYQIDVAGCVKVSQIDAGLNSIMSDNRKILPGFSSDNVTISDIFPTHIIRQVQ